MTADAHREVRELLGSYAVGALSEDEMARVRAHLDGCHECRELLADLMPVASALAAAVDPDRLSAEVPVVAPVEPLLAHVTGELGRRRRRRLTAAASAVAAVAATLLVALVALRGGGPNVPVPVERQLRGSNAGVTGTVALLDRFWGTQLTLKAQGLPAREPLVVWVQRRGGRRVPAGTLSGLGSVPIKAQLGASVRARDAFAVGVSDDEGTVLLTTSMRG